MGFLSEQQEAVVYVAFVQHRLELNRAGGHRQLWFFCLNKMPMFFVPNHTLNRTLCTSSLIMHTSRQLVFQMIWPVIVVQQLSIIISVLFIVLIGIVQGDLSLLQQIILNQFIINFLVTVSYAPIPLICLTKNNLLWTEATKLCTGIRCCNRNKVVPLLTSKKTNAEALREQEDHFEALENIWLKGKVKLAWVL